MSSCQITTRAELNDALVELKSRKASERTVIGIVHPDGHLLHAITKTKLGWQQTNKSPTVYLAEKLEIVVKSEKRFIIIIGGRGSSKSIGVVDIGLIDAKDDNAKTYYLREFQSSIRNSVQSLLEGEIERLEMTGFEVQGNTILHDGKPVAEFAGLARNVDSIKSAYGFKRFAIEESQFLAESSLTTLTPTVRNKPNKGLPGAKVEESSVGEGVSMVFIANPGSSEDPFSKRFIEPFIDKLDENGVYEDDLHLIVKMNYNDNPWYHESGLEAERLWDKEHRSTAAYSHIWGGEYNDSVEDGLIMDTWFNACIDAHLKLGFKANGARIASHDPSDTGGDSKGYCLRHGSVMLDVREKTDGDVNEGGHWATAMAITDSVDYFTWDCDGLGVTLNEQIGRDLQGKKIDIVMFKGSESPDFPNKTFNPAFHAEVKGEKKIEDVFRNKRNQYYFELARRIYLTYRAVVFGEYQNPDDLISFSSDIKLLGKVKAELCRMPIKPNSNGLLSLYTKLEMRSKFKITSPNLGDSVMMNMRYTPTKTVKITLPPRISAMGAR